jgi:GntR family transcriptional regulator, rspAB operon transcriptional repressor
MSAIAMVKSLPKVSSAVFGRDSGTLRESKVDRVYSALRRAIASGELPPNAPIDKGELAGRFGVSRLSITTAVNRLAFDRFVVVEPQRGSYVAKIRLTDAKQWMLVRRAVEVEVAGVGARELPDDSIVRLGHNLAYQQTAVASKDFQGFHELDTRFHRLIIDDLRLERVGEILDPLRTHLERIRLTLLPEPGRINTTYQEHAAIYRMIAVRDAGGSRDSMAAHLDRVLHELEDFAQRHPDFFEV